MGDLAIQQLKLEIEEVDKRMRNTILGIKNDSISREERMAIYNKVYKATESKHDESVWQKNCEHIYQLFIDLETSMIAEYSKKLNQLHDYAFLEYFDKFWTAIKLYTRWNLTIFFSAENYAKLFKKKTLVQATLEILRREIINFNEKLSTGLLKELSNDRNGNECNPLLIANLFKAYFEVDYEDKAKIEKIGDNHIYVFDPSLNVRTLSSDPQQQLQKQKTKTFCDLIKTKLLADTKIFYSKKVQEWLGLTVPDFLDTANNYLQKENERIDMYYPYERKDIWDCTTDQVIVKTANSIVSNNETGLLHLLTEKKTRYIKILYEFLDMIDHPLENLTAHFLDYIQKLVEQIKSKPVEEEGEDKQIEDIILFKQEIMKICNEGFNKNKAIINSAKLEMQRAFARIDEFPQKLAVYTDAFILKSGKNLDNEDVVNQINEIFDIISLTIERDKFLFYYEQALKGRLLSINNYNEGIENEFLKRLNQVMGEQQIIRIKGMIQDIINSKKLNSDLATFMSSKKSKYGSLKSEIFSVYLLTKSSWPADVIELETCQVPEDLAVYTQCFVDFFESQNPGQTKIVDWLLDEGFIEVSASLGSSKTKKVFILTVAQYSILQQLARSPDMKMSFNGIKEATKIKKILGALGPLVSKKLLTRENADIKQKIGDEEFLGINQDFQSKNREINFIQRKTLKTRSTGNDNDKIDEMRKVMIDAAIVRNMKSKKVSKFQELAADVRRMLQDNFQPPDNLLRTMIDDLIKRDFLERDENDMNVYRYKA